MEAKKPKKKPKSDVILRLSCEEGDLVIRRNKRGHMIWRVEVPGNSTRISGSTEGHTRKPALRRSLEISAKVLAKLASKV